MDAAILVTVRSVTCERIVVARILQHDAVAIVV